MSCPDMGAFGTPDLETSHTVGHYATAGDTMPHAVVVAFDEYTGGTVGGRLKAPKLAFFRVLGEAPAATAYGPEPNCRVAG